MNCPTPTTASEGPKPALEPAPSVEQLTREAIYEQEGLLLLLADQVTKLLAESHAESRIRLYVIRGLTQRAKVLNTALMCAAGGDELYVSESFAQDIRGYVPSDLH